jgi:hypothetical protein
MTTLSHEPSSAVPERRSVQLLVPELWPSFAIAVMWVVVLLDALFGPDIVTSDGAGTNTSTVPSAVAIALFVLLANWIVAHYAFRRRPKE